MRERKIPARQLSGDASQVMETRESHRVLRGRIPPKVGGGAGRPLATIAVRAAGFRVRQPGGHYNTFLALEASFREGQVLGKHFPPSTSASAQ
jgi:hypothetical protein